MEAKEIGNKLSHIIQLEIQGIYELGENVPSELRQKFITPKWGSSTKDEIESAIKHYSQLYTQVSDEKCAVEMSHVVLAVSRILVLLKSARYIINEPQ